MRKILKFAAAAATAVVLASPAMAQSWNEQNYEANNYIAPAAGVIGGTVVGVGLYNGWWGSGAIATSLGATAVSSAVAGGVVGVGVAAAADAVLQPCRGFSAMFNLRPTECVNGQWVGDRPQRVRYSRR